MRLDVFLVVPVLGALVAGCAAPALSRPSVDPTLTPEQIVRVRIPLIADTRSMLIADSGPCDRGHPGWGA